MLCVRTKPEKHRPYINRVYSNIGLFLIAKKIFLTIYMYMYLSDYNTESVHLLKIAKVKTNACEAMIGYIYSQENVLNSH